MGLTDHRSTAAGAGRYALDLTERVLATGAQAFGAELIAGGWFSVDQVTNLSIPQKAGVAALAAGLAVVKGAVAKWVADRNSASLAPGV